MTRFILVLFGFLVAGCQANESFILSKQPNFENVSFDEVLEFLKYPKKITEKITICIGQYGYYMKYNGRNYKINQSGKYTEEYCKSLIK